MPVIKSAMKRMRQETTRRARNRDLRDTLRSLTKKLQTAVDAKDSKKVTESLRNLQSHLDKMVKKNQMHKNTAARKKANAVKLAKSAGATTTAKKTTAKKPAAKSTAKKAPAKKATTAKKPAAKKTTAKKTTKKS